MTPLDAARFWIAQQLGKCPVRLDELYRSKLFAEVESAVGSVDHMYYHAQAIADSGLWSNYDVFLKACWRYLRETGRAGTPVGAVVLLNMVSLYRRRSSIAFQRAAARHLKLLLTLIDENSETDKWLLGAAAYHRAYMDFLILAPTKEAEEAFQASAQLEFKYGRPVGLFVSRAEAEVARARRLVRTQSGNIETSIAKLLSIRDSLAGLSGPLAESWVSDSLPAHLAYLDILSGNFTMAVESLRPLVARKRPNALWYTGLALLRAGERISAVGILEEARNRFYSDNYSERRAGVLVALGDAYELCGRSDEARLKYEEALKQPSHMDNAEAIGIAKQRIAQSIREPIEVYMP